MRRNQVRRWASCLAAAGLAACGVYEEYAPDGGASDSGLAEVGSDVAPSDVADAPGPVDDALPDAPPVDASDEDGVDPDAVADATESGDGSEMCPRVTVRCAIQGSGAAPAAEALEADHFDVVVCEAETALPLAGDDVVAWRIAEQPAGSLSVPEPATGAFSSLFLPVSGVYRIEAEVTRATGCVPVPAGSLGITVPLPPGIVATLAWTLESPATDPDRSDLDLHLLHPSGCWEDLAWDVHFRNPGPNWGDRTRYDDDPSMDIDAQGEGNVEVIVYTRPEAGRNYRIGVHLWQAAGAEAADAKLELHVAQTRIPVPSRRLTQGQFWEVAMVSWPSAEVTIIDRVHDRIDAAGCEPSP